MNVLVNSKYEDRNSLEHVSPSGIESVAYHVAIRAKRRDSTVEQTWRSKFEDTSCLATPKVSVYFPVLPFRTQTFPFCLKGHASSCPNPFNTYICIMYTNEYAGAPKGRAGFPCHKSYMYSREQERKKESKKQTKEPFYYGMATLRLTRISFVFCTVIIFSLFVVPPDNFCCSLNRTLRIISFKKWNLYVNKNVALRT